PTEPRAGARLAAFGQEHADQRGRAPGDAAMADRRLEHGAAACGPGISAGRHGVSVAARGRVVSVRGHDGAMGRCGGPGAGFPTIVGHREPMLQCPAGTGMTNPRVARAGEAGDGQDRADAAVVALVAELVARARAAQRVADGYDQARARDLALAAGWAILEPERNRSLAELAVADTGIGNVDDKIRKNHRKTLGLLRDLQAARTVGVISEDEATGITEIARPVGVVCAV